MKGGDEMRITVLVLMLMAIIAFVGSAIAVPPGKTVEFKGGPMGKVVFDGKIHMDKGLKCNDCHTKIFQMKNSIPNPMKRDIVGFVITNKFAQPFPNHEVLHRLHVVQHQK